MKCKICGWLCAWCVAEAGPVRASIRKQSEAWEATQSNEYELWSTVSDRDRERLDAAKAIRSTEPEAAFRIYLDLADAGVVWSMEMVAYQYAWGDLVAHDFEKAQTYYRRAIKAGSWMATLKYARLLADRGQFDICETFLQDCVKADFIPACYWLAWCRFQQSSDRATCRAIRPLLERAADAGHPAAALFLARLKVRGKFGFREIPRGFKDTLQIVDRTHAAASSSDSNPIPAPAA